jgi:hypothetical protein
MRVGNFSTRHSNHQLLFWGQKVELKSSENSITLIGGQIFLAADAFQDDSIAALCGYSVLSAVQTHRKSRTLFDPPV